MSSPRTLLEAARERREPTPKAAPGAQGETPARGATPPADAAAIRRSIAWAPALAGGVVSGIGGLVLVGWSTGTVALISIVPGWVAMMPLTATALVAAGGALVLAAGPEAGPRARGAAAALATLVLAIGLAVLAAYAGADLRIDALLFPEAVAQSQQALGGRPSWLTAFVFSLLSLDLLLLARWPRAARHLARTLEVLAGLVAFAVLLGYAFGIASFYGLRWETTMAVHTAVASLVLVAGLGAARPDWPPVSLLIAGGVPAMLLRRLLTFAFVAPVVLGAVLLASGEAGWLPREVAMTGMILAAVLGGVVLVSWTSMSVARQEAARLYALGLERELAAIVTSSDDAIISETLEGTLRTWNRGAETIYGYTADEAIGQPSTILMAADGAAEHATQRARVARGEHVAHVEVLHRRKDGIVVPVSVSMAPLHDAAGAIVGMASVARDESAARFAADALRASRLRLEAIVDASPAMIAIKDLDGRYELVNRATEILAGRPREALLGLGDEAVFEPAVVDAIREHERAALAARAPLDFEEVVRVRGEERTFLAVRFAVSTLDGTPYAIGGVMTDITERKRAIVAAARLYAQAAEAERVAALKDNLLSAFSHEIKTPLAVVLGNAELLEELHPDEPVAKALLDGASRLAAQVGRLIDISALIGGSMPLYLAPIDPLELLDQLRGLVAERLEAAGLQLETVAAPDLAPFEADAQRVLQLLVELVENARAHTPRGGHVRVSVGPVGDEVCLCVHDDGPGIAPERLASVWEAHESLAGDRPLGGGGLGIGLALVKRIAERHGGRVDMDDGRHGDGGEPCCAPVGVGTCVRVYLPRSCPAVA